MLCAKGPIVCPDRPILLSSKATHFALNSASLFLRAETIIPSRNNTSDTPRYFMIEKNFDRNKPTI